MCGRACDWEAAARSIQDCFAHTWRGVDVGIGKRLLSRVGQELGNLVPGIVGIEGRRKAAELTTMARDRNGSWNAIVVKMGNLKRGPKSTGI